MFGETASTNATTARALLVGSPECRSRLLLVLRPMGYTCVEVDDPYAAMLELGRSTEPYQAVVLSLSSLFREELAFVEAVKRRHGVEVWLSHTDGRAASLAQAMGYGIDGLLGNDGLHRLGTPAANGTRPAAVLPPAPPPQSSTVPTPPASSSPGHRPSRRSGLNDARVCPPGGEAVLTSEDLRALLLETPLGPSTGLDL
jgi:hypothetical protein